MTTQLPQTTLAMLGARYVSAVVRRDSLDLDSLRAAFSAEEVLDSLGAQLVVLVDKLAEHMDVTPEEIADRLEAHAQLYRQQTSG